MSAPNLGFRIEERTNMGGTYVAVLRDDDLTTRPATPEEVVLWEQLVKERAGREQAEHLAELILDRFDLALDEFDPTGDLRAEYQVLNDRDRAALAAEDYPPSEVAQLRQALEDVVDYYDAGTLTGRIVERARAALGVLVPARDRRETRG